ncbi:MAG TPA: hypothetical protein VI544_01115, partial [Candidatus Nanoarchaeia archaeon]|nr:hypothetical protein [Candidatus Nanoarchaeia archaeon]
YHRKREIYIPFGGALYASKDSLVLLEEMGAQDFEKGNDIRFTMPRQNLSIFEDWFRTRTGRETTSYRELYEELVEEQSVLDDFPESAISQEVLFKSCIEETHHPDRPGAKGLPTRRYLEVFEVQFADNYSKRIEDASHLQLPAVYLARPEEIENQLSAKGTPISDHSLHLL